ncbi:MAG: hypothetical protein KAG18_04525, partial [Sinobacterium sp.]|nr:hypothetical protein [Sinobacterium sp.]
MPEKKYRFQLLSGLIISTVVLLSLFNIHYLFISRGNFIVFVVTAPLGIFHAYLLATLSKQASSSRYSNYFIGSMLISICAGMMFTGGALENSTAYFLNVPILTAFLLVGRRLGLTYAFIALVFYLAIAIVERSGTAIP